MVDYISSHDMKEPEQYALACTWVDMESCIDYYAMEIYIANTDWPENNLALWRVRETSDQPFADGKWRWLEFDVNISMNVKTAKKDFVQRTALRDTMFSSLLDNPEFKAALYAKLVELAQNNYAPDRVDGFIKDYEERMRASMANDYLRFYGEALTEQDFIDKCEAINDFFQARYDYIMKTYGNE